MIFSTIFLISFMTMQVIGSAIPMWEFLSRKEKMSRLYRLFTLQVSQFCIDSSDPDCIKNFLITGIRNLADIDDNILDKLDPYQRGSREIIWRALIGTDRFSPRTSQDINGNFLPTNLLLIGNDDSETNSITGENVLTNDYIHVGPYLIGPMVTRVYPDGRPVPDDHKRFRPRDDDIDELKYTVVLPSISDAETKVDRTTYRNKILNNGRKDTSTSKYIALRRVSIKDHDRDYH